MIIRKNDNGTYLCESGGNFFNVDTKQAYLDKKLEIENIKEPTKEELIEIGKTMHPFFNKEIDILNIDNMLKKIEEFEGDK